jgi:hypothetical protein
MNSIFQRHASISLDRTEVALPAARPVYGSGTAAGSELIEFLAFLIRRM